MNSLGAVDLHFHGAFGIDLMSARTDELQDLSRLLGKHGIAAFCPTTLSSSKKELKEAVSRLGRWIRSDSAPGALPLGLHLEGPYLNPKAAGAHPPGILRPVDLNELEDLWEVSSGTLKILTVAPETLTPLRIRALVRWAHARGIVLSMGHSRATEAQAHAALDAGFTSVTHAWNAMPFHQREPGVLGAALGDPRVHVELIADQIHVAPSVIRWTLQVHGPRQTCFVSDCVPAAATRPGSRHPFSRLSVRLKDGACRLQGGGLAGGGRLLTETFARWINLENEGGDARSALRLLELTLPCITSAPLQSLGVITGGCCDSLTPKLAERTVKWSVGSDGQVRLASR